MQVHHGTAPIMRDGFMSVKDAQVGLTFTNIEGIGDVIDDDTVR